MQADEYMQRVLETESKPTELAASTVSLDLLLSIGISTAEIMNQAKRAIFYGKPLDKEKMFDQLAMLNGLTELLGKIVDIDGFADQPACEAALGEGYPDFLKGVDINKINMRLLHGTVGEISEAGEKLEALRAQMFGDQLDLVNFAEEMGDMQWYNAIQLDELRHLANTKYAGLIYPLDHFDVSEEAIRARNIAKLELRNKGRSFNAEATVNRDTDAERVVLEQSGVK